MFTVQVSMLEKLVKELPDLLQRNTDLLTGDNFKHSLFTIMTLDHDSQS